MVAAAAGSLADTHASAVAVATLAHAGKLSIPVAVEAIAVGLLTNTFSRILAALAGGGRSFAMLTLLWHLPAAFVLGTTVLLLT